MNRAAWLAALLLAAMGTRCGRNQPLPAGSRAAASQRVPVDAADFSPVAPGAEGAHALADWRPTRVAAAHLPNVFQIDPHVLSGGQPDGEAAFAELQKLGVRTVISVDGARPDVAAAKKYGLRYVHLPHGYDGISPERVRELAKAVCDLPGPIYIHCHHGKHRSPAAAAAACVGAGLIVPAQALLVLETAGTSPHYEGLYQVAQEARPLSRQVLDQMPASFPETAELPPLAAAMVELEQTHDHLKLIATAGWQTPERHPALSPPHEALLLREQYTELLRLPAVQGKGAEFLAGLQEGETAAAELESLLRTEEGSPARLERSLEAISQGCVRCHRAFRDLPRKAPASGRP